MTKWPIGFWNVVNVAFRLGWEQRVLNRPQDFDECAKKARQTLRDVFFEEKFPKEGKTHDR